MQSNRLDQTDERMAVFRLTGTEKLAPCDSKGYSLSTQLSIVARYWFLIFFNPLRPPLIVNYNHVNTKSVY